MSDENPARWERLLQAILRFGEPEDIDKILREFGTPDQFLKRKAELDEMLENRRRVQWLFSFIKVIAVWIGAVGVAIGIVYGGLSFVLPLLHRDETQQQDDQP